MVSIVRSFSVVAEAVRDVSITGVPVVTVTVSDTPETFITIGSEIAWPTVNWRFSCTVVANPASVHVTR